MFSFIIKRLLYCVLVIFGVVLLTFVLFNVAAGDPAAALLGKNPSPQEVELLRRELGSDLPMLWGKYRKSEVFNNFNAKNKRFTGNVSTLGEVEFAEGGLRISKDGGLYFKRNFSTPGESVFVEVDGKISEIKPEDNEFSISGTEVVKVEFFRPNTSTFNSQFTKAMGEIITINAEKPYVHFLNFGRTLITREPISEIIARGVVPSLCLMLPIFIGELVLGVILALVSTACKESIADKAVLLASISMISISYLVVIIFAQWSLGYYYNLFPVWGWGSWHYLILPVLVGIVCGVGASVRFYRSVFVNELNKEYLRTATAKGCAPITIYSKHLLRNAMIPIITRAGSALPFLFTGSLLLESFFGIPGLGYAGLDALNNSDLQLLKALVVVSALLFVVINLITDIIYAWADPRIRL